MIQQQLSENTKIETSPLPDHLIALPGGRWALWRCVGLRGAGFPAEQILNLVSPEAAKTANQLLQAEEELVAAQEAALDALRESFQICTDDPAKRKALNKARKRIIKTNLPDPLAFDCPAQAAIDKYRQAYLKMETAQTEFQQGFLAASRYQSEAIYEMTGQEPFREAITWQNRAALHRGVDYIRRHPPGDKARTSKERRNESLIVNYMQRYCVKNDTIGFFGPVGWAEFVDDSPALDTQPGETLLSSRSVYFEGWCIDALADALGRNKAIRPWIAPRRNTYIHVSDTHVHLPFREPLPLPPEQIAILQVCDGEQTAQQIAQYLLKDGSFKTEEEIYQLLGNFNSMGLVTWSLDIPLQTYPEKALRCLLERIEDERIRRLNLRALSVFEKARENIAQAAGNAKQLDRALHTMDVTFTRLTGASATRSAGEVYAARTLVYEDSCRNIDVSIGPAVQNALGDPLSLILESARWFTFEAIALYRQILQEIYTKLVQKTNNPVLRLIDVWPEIQSKLLIEEGEHPLDALVPVFQERWAKILDLPTDVRHVTYRADELRPFVLDLFEPTGQGCPSIVYQSPDIFIAAPSVEHVQKGDFYLVMGELHMGKNTLNAGSFVSQHPNPDKFLQAIIADHPQPRILPIVPKQWPGLTTRTRVTLAPPQDYHLAFTHETGGALNEKTLNIGSLLIEETNDGLITRTYDGKVRFEAIELVATLISESVSDYFKILPHRAYNPRVTIDRLVISRESWSFPVGELDFAYLQDASERFLACQRWLQTHGIPRFTFAKTPVERKPFFIDFDSPILVDILATYVRRTNEQESAETYISLTEMLPDLSQTWLTDSQNQHYTNELRIVARERPSDLLKKGGAV